MKTTLLFGLLTAAFSRAGIHEAAELAHLAAALLAATVGGGAITRAVAAGRRHGVPVDAAHIAKGPTGPGGTQALSSCCRRTDYNRKWQDAVGL